MHYHYINHMAQANAFLYIVARGKTRRGAKQDDLCFPTLKIINFLSISNIFISMVPLDSARQSTS